MKLELLIPPERTCALRKMTVLRMKNNENVSEEALHPDARKREVFWTGEGELAP